MIFECSRYGLCEVLHQSSCTVVYLCVILLSSCPAVQSVQLTSLSKRPVRPGVQSVQASSLSSCRVFQLFRCPVCPVIQSVQSSSLSRRPVRPGVQSVQASSLSRRPVCPAAQSVQASSLSSLRLDPRWCP